MVKTYRLS